MNIINALSRFLRNLARVGVFAILSAGATLQTTAADNEVDYAQKLSRAHLFLQPLAWVGTNAPTAEESRDLYEAAGLDVDHKPTDRVGSMEGYIVAPIRIHLGYPHFAQTLHGILSNIGSLPALRWNIGKRLGTPRRTGAIPIAVKLLITH